MPDPMPDGVILLVEDDRGIAQLIEYALEDLQLSIAHVTSGQDAARWLSEHRAVLMLLDYSLPDMNAAGLLSLLVELQLDAPPFVVTTGAGDERIAVEMMRRKARDYVVKDAQFLDALPGVVQRVLRALATEQQLAAAQEALRQLNEELEQRVDARTAELRAANAALERASRMKDEFLASMSHELRTPLTGILGLAEGLLEQVPGSINERQTRYVQSIHDNGRHLLELINSILDYSTLEAGQMKVHLEPGVVHDICRGSISMIRNLAEKKGIKITYQAPAQPLVLATDSRRLKQILVNLLSNAVKFTPEGGEIGLDVVAEAEVKTLRLEVWDTGIGIASADLHRIFDPFVQLDSRLSRYYAGTGLGLALVERMVNLLGGSVTVQSEFDKGSRFGVALSWQPPGAALPPVTQLENGAGRHPQVLLAEDVESSVTTYCALLAALGCTVTVARSGEETLQLARELLPDVIIASAQLPGSHGQDLCRRLRNDNDPCVAMKPLVMTTSLVIEGDQAVYRAAGASEVLAKPLDLTALSRTLLNYLAPITSLQIVQPIG